MEIFYDPDLDMLDKKASEFFAYHTRSILQKKDRVVWALPGGRSVSGIYKALASRSDIEWNKVHFFIIDERLVPINDPESNFRLLDKNLTGPLLKNKKISDDNIHPFIFKPGSGDLGLADYEIELKRFGGHFDIILLSSGEDGHIAGLYPKHPSIKNGERYFFTMDDSPKLPKKRMSSSKNLILDSFAAALLFYGESKRDALGIFMDKEIDEIDCPAKIISNVTNNLILTDQKI